jgi:flagellar basal-body rod protein FlgB
MSQLYIFALASQHNRWLATRQSSVATNVANANTPGFKAQDVTPFDAVLDSMRIGMTASDPKHMSVGDIQQKESDKIAGQDSWEVTHSGNSVNLEQELIKAGEIGRDFRLNANVVKTFHRMLLASTKV